MALTTFSELKTAIQDWAERTDLSAKATDFVTLTEMRIRKALGDPKLRLREMETTADIVPSSGVCTLPTDFLAMKRVRALTSPARRLEYKPQDWLDEAYPDGDSGDPAFYTITGASLYMYPLTTSSIRMTYHAYPAILSDSNTTNWLLTKYPDVYLYGGLVELATYAGDNDATQKWLGFFQGAIAGLSSMAATAAMSTGTTRSAAGPAP